MNGLKDEEANIKVVRKESPLEKLKEYPAYITI